MNGAEDQLQRLPAEVAPPPAAAELEVGEELSFLVLRQKAAEYMRQHADEFKPFVLEVSGSVARAWQLCLGLLLQC
jgi:hypothetical protein